MKAFFKTVCILVLLSNTTMLFAQRGFRVGVDIHGGIGFDQPVRLTNPQASANLVGGWQFNPHLFLGWGMGIGHFCPLYDEQAKYPGGRIDAEYIYLKRNMFQLFIREKVNILNGKVSPFTILDFGYPVSRKGKGETQLFVEPGLGCDFRIGDKHSLNVMMGYRIQEVNYKRSVYNIYDELHSTSLQKVSGQLTLHLGFTF